MFETISRKPEIDAFDIRGKVLDDIRGDVELRDVHFSYPARPDEQILRGLCLFIPNGVTTALVGQSGSGKSTVISLIERFYDPQAGEVLIDGVNLKELRLKWIRSKIGLVSQEPVLFTGSIKDNIAYGKDGATDDEIRAASQLANAATFIDRLPQVRYSSFRAPLYNLSIHYILVSLICRRFLTGVRYHGWRTRNAAFGWAETESCHSQSNSKRSKNPAFG